VNLADPPHGPLARVPGVYQVQIMNPDDPSKPFPIPRFMGTDLEGILTIGETVNLGHRINNIRYRILNRKGHDEWGLFYHVYGLCPRMKETFGPLDEVLQYLVISYVEMEPSLIRSGEIRWTDRYMGRFGEWPPLCSQMPGDPRTK